MEIFFFWLIFSFAVGVLAANKGRSGVAWFFLSLVISPLLGLLFCAVSSNLSTPGGRAGAPPTSATHAQCPACAEFVLPAAVKCKHCGSPLVPKVSTLAADRAIDRALNRKALGICAGIVGAMFLALMVTRVYSY